MTRAVERLSIGWPAERAVRSSIGSFKKQT